MSGSGACRDNLDSWLDDAEIDAPAPQETPARQEPKFDRSGLKEAYQRALALGRTHQTTDIQLFLDMLLEIERYEHRDPAFQKLLKAAETLDRLDWVIGYEMKASEMQIVDEALGLVREALRLAREGEE